MTEQESFDDMVQSLKELDIGQIINVLLFEMRGRFGTIRGWAEFLKSEVRKHDFERSEDFVEWFSKIFDTAMNTNRQIHDLMETHAYNEEGLSIILHEIRNPITLMRVYPDLMRQLIERNGIQLPEIFLKGINAIYESACYMETLGGAIYVSQFDNQ